MGSRLKIKFFSRSRITTLPVLTVVIFAAWYYKVDQYLTFDTLKAQRENFQYLYDTYPWQTVFVFVGGYILVTALSIPGITVLTVGAGSLFGLGWGTVLVSFAGAQGAVLAFLICRYLLRDFVETTFPTILNKVNRRIAEEGNSYLFALRLVPLFPFFVVNAVMGLTRIRTFSFYWVSQIGMLPGTLLYVNVGRELAVLESLSNIISPRVLISFAFLGLFPLIAKRVLAYFRTVHIYKPYTKPKKKL